MLKTTSSRLKQLLVLLGKNQYEFAAALQVKQPSVNKWCQGGVISLANLQKIQDVFNVRQEWLLFGTGEMFSHNHSNRVEEPMIIYQSDKYTEAAIAERFSKAISAYCAQQNINQKELCKLWNINETQLSSILNGNKSISVSILQSALRFGNINLNYVMGNVGGIFTSTGNSAGSDDVKELIELVKEQCHKIEELSGKQKKRA